MKLVLLWTAEAAKAMQMGLFDANAGQVGDLSRGGRLVKEIRVHRNGRRVTHWVLRPEAETAAPAPAAPRMEGRRAANIRFELRADVSRMWQMEAQAAYSGILPVIAVREAAQNGIDAIRKAMKQGQVTEGHFDVTYDKTGNTLTIADNGVGMDQSVLQDKFLTLGATGKGSDSGAVGGFGVAKAAILGSVDLDKGGGWEIHTRDVRLTNDMLARDLSADEVRAPRRQGTQLILKTPRMEWYQERNLQPETVDLLASSDLGKGITATFNGEAIRPLWAGKRGKVMDFGGIDWPEGVKATVTRFKVPDGAGRTGRVYVRTGGLTQFADRFYAKEGSEHDYVIDLDITARPGTDAYPLNKARQGFQGAADSAYRSVKSAIERELQADDSTKREQEWEDFAVDADGKVSTTTGAQMVDESPDDIAEMLKGMGGAEAIKDLDEIVRGVAGPEAPETPRQGVWKDTAAPTPGEWTQDTGSVLGTLKLAVEQSGGRVERIVTRGTQGGLAPQATVITADEAENLGGAGVFGAEAGEGTVPVRLMDGPNAGKVMHFKGRDLHDELKWQRPSSYEHVPHHGGKPLVTPEEAEALREHAREARNRGEEYEETGVRVIGSGHDGGHGLEWLAMNKAGVTAKLAELRGGGPTTTPTTPATTGRAEPEGWMDTGSVRRTESDQVTGIQGQVKIGLPFAITRNNAAWPKRRKLNLKKMAPGLLVWDSIVRATASAAGIGEKLKTGLVLDPGVNGLHNVKGGVDHIYVNPDKLMEWLGPKADPMAAAVKLHALAVHELTHNNYHDHDEQFSSWREELGRRSAHAIPALAAIVERVTGRKTAASAERDKLAKGLEKAKAAAAAQRAEHRKKVSALEAEVKRLQSLPAAPPPAAAPEPPKRDIFAEAQHELAERRGMVKGAHAVGISEFKHHGRDAWAAVGPDPSKPGRFRTTRYDGDGLSGHTEHATIGDALHHLAREGYTHPAPGSLDRLVSAAPPPPPPQASAPPAAAPPKAPPGQLGLFGGETTPTGPKKRVKPANPDQLGFSFKSLGGMLGALRVNIVRFGGGSRASA